VHRRTQGARNRRGWCLDTNSCESQGPLRLERSFAESTMRSIHPELLLPNTVGELDSRNRDGGRGE
jgi:hypothetical protein